MYNVSILNRSSTGENDQLIGNLMSLINQLSLAIESISILLVLLIFLVLTRAAYSRSPFFLIYKVGLVYDIIALMTTLALRTIPSFGYLEPILTSSPYPAQITLFFNYFTRVGQGLTNLFVCLNRASAILFPLLHEKLWNNCILLPFCFSIQLGSSIVIGLLAASFGVHWLRYPQGQLYAMPSHGPALHQFWLAIFVPVVAIILAISVLYIVIILQFRRRLKASLLVSSLHDIPKTPRGSTEARQGAALFLIALCNIGIEVIYCAAYFHSFVYKINYQRDYRIFFAGNIVLVNCYSVVPCCLLCLFCANVRRDAWRFVRGSTKEVSTTPIKTIMDSNISTTR